MKVTPFTSVNGLSFGMSREAVVASIGDPSKVRSRKEGSILQLVYASARYRFDEGALTEITVDAPIVEIGAVSISFQTLAPYLKKQDPGAFEKVGFIVSPSYGLAFDPQHASWVTAFPKERLPLWRAV
jgi:hypothetical protein